MYCFKLRVKCGTRSGCRTLLCLILFIMGPADPVVDHRAQSVYDEYRKKGDHTTSRDFWVLFPVTIVFFWKNCYTDYNYDIVG